MIDHYSDIENLNYHINDWNDQQKIQGNTYDNFHNNNSNEHFHDFVQYLMQESI